MLVWSSSQSVDSSLYWPSFSANPGNPGHVRQRSDPGPHADGVQRCVPGHRRASFRASLPSLVSAGEDCILERNKWMWVLCVLIADRFNLFCTPSTCNFSPNPVSAFSSMNRLYYSSYKPPVFWLVKLTWHLITHWHDIMQYYATSRYLPWLPLS